MTKLTRKQRDLLSLAERQVPQTIYRLAQMADRPYRRVHDHVRQLESMGLVRLQKTRVNNRQAMLVVPTDPCYQRLMHLDEMYRAWREISPLRQ